MDNRPNWMNGTDTSWLEVGLLPPIDLMEEHSFDLDLDLEDSPTDCAILDQDILSEKSVTEQNASDSVRPFKSTVESSDVIDGSALVSGILSDLLNSVVDHCEENRVLRNSFNPSSIDSKKKFQNVFTVVEIIDSIIVTAVDRVESNKKLTHDVIGVASETGINQYEQAISDGSNELTTMSVNDNVDGNFDESTSSNLIISESFSMLLNDENVSSSRFEREDNVWNFHDDFVLTDVGSLSNETIDSEKSNTKNNSDLNSGGGVSSLFLPNSSRFSGERKIAKVMPYAGPYEEITLKDEEQQHQAEEQDPLATDNQDLGYSGTDSADDNLSRIVELVDELESERMDSNNVATVRPVASGLRLKNFATLMASPEPKNSPNNASQTSCDSSTPSSTMTSWHLAPAEPPVVALNSSPLEATNFNSNSADNCNKSSFLNADEEIHLTYLVNSPKSLVQKRYHIFTSTEIPFLKLFVHDQVAARLSQNPVDWKTVYITFWPNKSNPTHVRIIFVSGPRKEIVAKLPANNDVVLGLIDDNSSFFAVSFSRVKDINTSLYNQHKRPFISYALKNGNNVMSVDLDRKDAPYAVPLFAHLDNVGYIDDIMRQRSRGHIALAFHHHNIASMDADSIENIVFTKSKNVASTYKSLIEKTLEREISKKYAPKVTPAINNNTQSNLQQQPVSMQQQVVREPVQAFQSTSQQVMNSGNNLPLYQELPQQVNQIGDNFLFNPQQQVYSTTTCQSNTQQKQPAYSNISFQVMPQQNQQQPQHQGFTNTNFQVQQQQVPQTQHQSYTNTNFQVQQQQANPSNTNFPILSQLVAPPPPSYSMAVGNRLQLQPQQQQQAQQQVTTPIITSVTGGPVILNGLGQVVRVEAIPQPPVIDLAQEVCKLCLNSYADQSQLILHLTMEHFIGILTRNLPSAGKTGSTMTCSFSGCNMTFQNKLEIARHVGVTHQKSLIFYRAAQTAMLPFGKIELKMFKCPLTPCSTDGPMDLTEFLHHQLNFHYATNISTDISNFQTAAGHLMNVCPVDNCGLSFSGTDLIRHYGVDHCAVLDMYMVNVLGSPAGNALQAYKKALGYEDLVCQYKTKDNVQCGATFGFRTALMYHLSTSHYFETLLNLFRNRSTPEQPTPTCSERRKCTYCQKIFDIRPGVIHLGVEHSVANMMIEAYNKASARKGTSVTTTPSTQSSAPAPTSAPSPIVKSTLPTFTLRSIPSLDMPILATALTIKPTDIKMERRNNQAVQPAAHGNPSSSSSSTTAVPLHSDSYYECPFCFATCSQTSNPSDSIRSFAFHILNEHKKAEFENLIVRWKPKCPFGCNQKTQDIGEMTKHLKAAHPLHTFNFVRNEMMKKNMNFDECRKTGKPSTIQRTATPIISQAKPTTSRTTTPATTSSEDTSRKTAQKLFEDFKLFCQDRKLDSRKCEISWINVYLNFSFNKSKPDPDEMLQLIKMIEQDHLKLPNGDTIENQTLIKQFKSKMELLKAERTPLASTSTTKTPTNTSDGQPIDINNTDNVFVCIKCNLEFPNVLKLIFHVRASDHSQAKIGCKFCDEHYAVQRIKVDWVQHAEAALVLHTYGSDHLYNRWFYSFSNRSNNPNLKVRKSVMGSLVVNNLTSVHRCEACSKEVTKLQEHVNTKQHGDNTYIINNYVAHCDQRRICPVTCSVGDLIFYFSYIFPKTKQNKQNKLRVNIHQVLLVLSRIHDPIDGMDISAEPVVEEHITRLLSNSGNPKPVPQFICYTCPHLSSNLEDFGHHLKTTGHFTATSLWATTKSGNALRCDACDATFANLQNVTLHSYSRIHQNALWHHANTAESFHAPRIDNPETFCHLCECDVTGPNHVTSKKHLGAVAAADRYLSYCKKNGLNPSTLNESYLKSFFNQSFTSAEDSPRDVLTMLGVVDKLHDPIDGVPVGNHAFYIRLCTNLQKLQERKHAKDDDYQSSPLATSSPDPSLIKAKTQHNSTSSPGPSSMRAKTQHNTTSSPGPSSMKAKTQHYSCLSPEELESVTQCSECHLKFIHATYLVYHVTHMHKKSPKEFLSNFTRTKFVKNCQKCMKKCFTPMVLALHHDRHHLVKPYECPNCLKSYLSPAAYYKEDFCRKNALPETTKVRAEQAIKDVVQTNPASLIIGEPNQQKRKASSDDDDDDDDDVINKRPSKKSKRTISTSSSGSDRSDPGSRKGSTDLESRKVGSDCFGIAARKNFLIKHDPKLKMKPNVAISFADRNVADQALNFKKNSRENKLIEPSLPLQSAVIKPVEIPQLKTEEKPKDSIDVKASVKVEPNLKPDFVEVKKLRGRKSSAANRQKVAPILIKENITPDVKPDSVVETTDQRSNSKDLKRTTDQTDPKNLKRKSDSIDEAKTPEPLTKRLRHISKNSAKDESDQTIQVEPKLAIKIPAKMKNLPPQAGFCLECEHCTAKNCDHLTHSRKIFDDLACHARDSGHKRFQLVKDYQIIKCKVNVPDLALSPFYGHKIRKQFKRYVKSVKEKDVNWSYGRERKCKVSVCKFKSSSVVDMFRHYRESHLAVGDDSSTV